jgi:hypothetical protein
MRPYLSYAGWGALILGAGCGPSESPRRGQPRAENAAEASAENQPDFSGRLEAAKAISNTDMRDDALSAVAQDAAEAGAAEAAREALTGITDVETRNGLAETVALKLAEAGQEGPAVEVARGIHDVEKRNEVLARIAAGE